jgi:small neutral amino acid transporter SnatA (MarC family)
MNNNGIAIIIMGGKCTSFKFAIPVVHIAGVFIVLWVANKMIKYDEQEKLRFIELSHFPSTVDGSI